MAFSAFKLANESRGGYQRVSIVRNQAGVGPAKGHVTSGVVERPRLSVRTCAAFRRAFYLPGSGVFRDKSGNGGQSFRVARL